MFLGACNNDVFVPRPSDTPDIVEPDPDPDPEPESDDSLRVVGFKYNDASLKVSENILTYQAETTFINNTNYRGATILFDNYNNSVVRISSNTYWVLPWVTEPEYMIDIPGIKDGIPGFYGEKAPFKIGSFAIPYQYMPGHKEYFDLPPHSKVTAVVTYNRRRVRATGILTYGAPFVGSRQLDDGTLVSSPLEDMSPFLPRKEFEQEMIIQPVQAELSP